MLRIQNVTDVINRIAVGLCLRVEEVRWRDCCGSTRTRESLCCNCGNLVLRYLHVTGANMCHSVAFDSCKMRRDVKRIEAEDHKAEGQRA